jgi:hypothetical protein
MVSGIGNGGWQVPATPLSEVERRPTSAPWFLHEVRSVDAQATELRQVSIRGQGRTSRRDEA